MNLYLHQSGLGSTVSDAKDRAQGIQDGAQEVLDIAEGAKATSDAIGDIGDAVLKFFSFGADDIKAPLIGYNKDLSPKQVNVHGTKAFLAAVVKGYVFSDDQWVYLGLKPPTGSGKPGQIWDGVTGRWVGAGQAPTDTTTPPINQTQLALAQQMTNTTFSAIGIQTWEANLATATVLVAQGNYALADKLQGAGKAGLSSMIRQVGLAWTRLATTMGLRVTKGALLGQHFAVLNAARISQLVKLVAQIPANQRPAGAGALGALAADADVDPNTGKTKTKSAGPGQMLTLAAVLFGLMKFLG